MTRKDYQLLAKWAGRQRLPIALFQSLCDELQGQNAKFDRERFRKACIAEICTPKPVDMETRINWKLAATAGEGGK